MRTTSDQRSAVAGGGVPLLKMEGIRKSFGPIKVLDGIDLTCHSGTLTAVCGENGAGKSTLMRILSGVFAPSDGEIHIDGRPVVFTHPAQAMREGVAIIHQELNLLPYRTVADNIFLGREPTRFGFIDRAKMNREASVILHRLGCNIDPDKECRKLSIAEQQLVEIAKALSERARILIFDEPTAALNETETQALFRLICELKQSGVALLYISHRMAEIKALADTITIIKDGRQVITKPADELSIDDVIQLMVGRELTDFFPAAASSETGAVLYDIKNAGHESLKDISLTLRAGEIVGIAGLEGCGKTELARAMSGEAPFTRGDVRLWDGMQGPRSPREAARRGIGAIPEDRKVEGLGLRQSLRDNAAITLRALGAGLSGATRGPRATRFIDTLLDKVEVKSAGYDMPVGQLSGGNQQKILFARWMAINPRVWIVNEPTRGIDVGARAAIYAMLRAFAEEGGAVMVVSSDLMEIIGLSDRICVMSGGRLAAHLQRGASEEEIMRYAVH